MKQFATRRRELSFSIDEDEFHLKAIIPAGTMFRLTKLQSKMDAASESGEGIDMIVLDIMKDLLKRNSFEQFRFRFYGNEDDEDTDGNEYGEVDPIDLETFTDVIEWIIGESLGKEPTPKPSS